MLSHFTSIVPPLVWGVAQHFVLLPRNSHTHTKKVAKGGGGTCPLCPPPGYATGAERELFLANTFFQHKMIHLYTWRRGEDGGDKKSLTDYIAVDERLRKDVLDAKVVRGALEGSDNYAVVVEIMLRDKREFCRKIGEEKEKYSAS